MYCIEKQKDGEWQVSSTYTDNYPLSAILDAARQLRRILPMAIRVTHRAFDGTVSVLDGAK